jgi:hypothetical protein
MTAKSKAPDRKDGEEYGKGKPGPLSAMYQKIIETLDENVRRTPYGEVGVSFKVHGNRIASVCYSTTENQIQKAGQV